MGWVVFWILLVSHFLVAAISRWTTKRELDNESLALCEKISELKEDLMHYQQLAHENAVDVVNARLQRDALDVKLQEIATIAVLEGVGDDEE